MTLGGDEPNGVFAFYRNGGEISEVLSGDRGKWDKKRKILRLILGLAVVF